MPRLVLLWMCIARTDQIISRWCWAFGLGGISGGMNCLTGDALFPETTSHKAAALESLEHALDWAGFNIGVWLAGNSRRIRDSAPWRRCRRAFTASYGICENYGRIRVCIIEITQSSAYKSRCIMGCAA